MPTCFYNLTDPNLPKELHLIRDIFLPAPDQEHTNGYQKAKLAAEKLRLQTTKEATWTYKI